MELLYKKYVDQVPVLFSNPKFNIDTIEKKEEVLRVIVWRRWFNEEHRNKYRRKAREALGFSDDDDDGELKVGKCCFFDDGTCEKQKKEGNKVTYTREELSNTVPVGSKMAGKNCCRQCKDALNAEGRICALADTRFCAIAEKARKGGKKPVYKRFRNRVPEWYQKARNERTRKYCCPACADNLRYFCVFQWDGKCQSKTRISKAVGGGTKHAKHQKFVPANKKNAGAPCCDACFERNNFS